MTLRLGLDLIKALWTWARFDKSPVIMCCNWLIAARASSYVDLTSFIYVRACNFYSLIHIFGSKTQPFSSCLYTRVSSFLRWSSCFASGVDYNKLHGLGRPLQSCLCTSALVLLRYFLSIGALSF